MQQTPTFHSRLFWDIDVDKLNYETSADFIIERIFERGDVDDIRQCRRYYGDERIREALTNAKWLSLETIYLAVAILNNELTDYKCYITAQSNLQHWTY